MKSFDLYKFILIATLVSLAGILFIPLVVEFDYTSAKGWLEELLVWTNMHWVVILIMLWIIGNSK